MFDQVQVQALAGPLKDIQRLVPKPLLGCVLRATVPLEGEPAPTSEILSMVEQVFISLLCAVYLSLGPD